MISMNGAVGRGIVFFLALMLLSCDGGQKADPEYKARTNQPAFVSDHPKVLFDEGHENVHTVKGTYEPFADLLGSDGYAVISTNEKFSRETLEGSAILVIVNPRGKEEKFLPAFTEDECDAVEQWVTGGGSLLLIADHYPIGSGAEILSKRFSIMMSKGFTNDSLHCDPTSVTGSPLDGTSQLLFTRENGLLADHPITNGRDSSEHVNRVMAFTGQSLLGPAESEPLLKLAPSAYDIVPDSIWQEKEWLFFTNTYTRFSDPVSAAGRAQGVALKHGQGRVVVLGEAAMLTAQVYREERFGMQVPGIDNKQFALNIMHWLSRLL